MFPLYLASQKNFIPQTNDSHNQLVVHIRIYFYVNLSGQW